MIKNEKIYNFTNIIEVIKSQIVDMNDFNNSKLKDIVKILCENCKKEYKCKKRLLILKYIRHFNNGDINYKKCCSNKCSNILRGLKISEIRQCTHCQKSFKSSGNKRFCSHGC